MNIEDFKYTQLEKSEGITTGSFSFGRGEQQNFIYGRKYHTGNGEDLQLIYLHDIGEHGNRYQSFFHSFLKTHSIENTSVHTLDFRGHGKSSGTRGHLKNIDDLCFDVIGHINHIAKSDGNIVLMGTGLGGIVALKILHLHFSFLKVKVNGLILINPALKLNWTVPAVLEGLARHDYLPFNKMKLPFVLEGVMFCGESSIAEEFDSDPLVNHTLTWGSLFELQHNASLIRTSAYYLDIPVFVGLSGKGSLYNKQVTELFAKGITDITFEHYYNASHDLLHNFDCEKLSQDVYNWLKKNSL